MNLPDDPKGSGASQTGVAHAGQPGLLAKLRTKLGGTELPPGPPQPPDGDEDGDDDGLARMSFFDHLQELRTRIIRSVAGLAVAFVVALFFSNQLWGIICQPAVDALTILKVNPPDLTMIEPMEGFNIVWFKLPILCAIFMASPWVLYQVWAFIAPGLYARERRWAAPFVLFSAGLFVLGGCFAYFVVFRFGLTFLLGIGIDYHVRPMVSIGHYFDLFVNVMLGVGLVFELPVLIFFLTLLRVLSPAFLLRHSRYAILVIFIIAAIVTPTPDVFNLTLFAAPMCLLFYVGIFASFLLVWSREGRKFPWRTVILVLLAVLLVVAAGLYMSITRYGFHVVPHWPFLVR